MRSFVMVNIAAHEIHTMTTSHKTDTIRILIFVNSLSTSSCADNRPLMDAYTANFINNNPGLLNQN